MALGAALVVGLGVAATTRIAPLFERPAPVALSTNAPDPPAATGPGTVVRNPPQIQCTGSDGTFPCVRWMELLDHPEPPEVITTPLGPLLHGGATLALHDLDTGQVVWVHDLGEQNGHVVGVTPADDITKIILALGDSLAFLDLRTGTLHDGQHTTETDGHFDSILIADGGVHTATLRYSPDGPPTSIVVAAWTPEGRSWEVEVPLDIDWDYHPWAHIVDVTLTDVVVHTRDVIVFLDATTGEERQRRSVQPGQFIIHGEVLLRAPWDDRGPGGTSTLHAENLSSGEALWAQELRAGAHWWRLAAGSVGVFDRRDLVALDTRTGEILWTLPLASAAERVWSDAPETGVLVLADLATDRLRGIEAATGEELWRVTSPWTLPSDLPWASPDDGHLVLRRPQRDGIMMLDRQTGRVVVDIRTDGRLAGEPWHVDVPWPILQSSTGHLYLVSLDLPEAPRRPPSNQ